MNILLISYGIYEFDGRLRELIKVSKKIGDTKYITRVNSFASKKEDDHLIFKSSKFFEYLLFNIFTFLKSLKMNRLDVLFLDNRKSIIPGLFVIFFKKPKVVYDARELYFFEEKETLIGKIGCFFEKIIINKADIIISANKYRSKIMKKYYRLGKKPLVYENIRKLEYDKNISINEFKRKYDKYFSSNTTKIISTSGCNISRNNDKLVESMKDLDSSFELFLVGESSDSDKRFIKKIIKKNNLKNVYIINKLETNELKYFIQNCHIGIVNYNKSDLNNKFCASGKIYEFLFEGLPVVTTDNPPLVDFCKQYKIGVYDNKFKFGIKKIKDNYNIYKNNVKNFVDKLDVDNNNEKLATKISEILISKER